MWVAMADGPKTENIKVVITHTGIETSVAPFSSCRSLFPES